MKSNPLKFVVFLCLSFYALLFAKEKKPTAQIAFTVLRESNSKPVRNASVILHSVHKDGTQDKDAYEVKTDAEGKVSLSGLDFGKYRIQVIAEHLQTFGSDLEVSEQEKQMTIKLKPPQSQYSIY